MPPESLDVLLMFFKLLADETRLRLLGLAGLGEHTVEELAATLGVKEPTVSHHLGKLKELNLVRMRAEGNSRYYSLNKEALRALSKDVLTPEALTEVTTRDLDAGSFARKVLDTFLVDGRLVQIPAQRKKRDVILAWLAGHFDPGQRYEESEVNQRIRQYHDDTATLRRELIMTGLLRRADGQHGRQSVYWRSNG